MKHTAATLLLSGLLLVSGCGGAGGAASTPVPTVSGVAATGAAIVGTVYLKDASAPPKELTRQTGDGSFSFDVTGLTKPFLLKAAAAAGGTPALYSLAADPGTANINPLTSLVLANAAAGADLAGVYAAPGTAGVQGIAANLPQALANIQATLRPLLLKYGVATTDPIRDSFKADGSGLDHLLDLVQIRLDGSGSVTITETGSAPVTRDVVAGFSTHALSGAVTLNGAPFAGVTVSVTDAATGTQSYGSVQTGASGGYLIANLVPGSYTVTPGKPGYSFDRASSSVTIAETDCEVPAFRSFQPYSVVGTVASSNGRGLAGVTVSAARVGAAAVSAVTNGSGRYTLSGLGNGDYTVSATRVYNTGAVSFDAPHQLTLSAAANFGEANFAASVPSYTVSGNVAQLSGGAGVGGVAIRLVTKNDVGALLTNSAAIFNTVSDAAGNYALSGLPDGYYALSTTLSGLGFALLDAFATNGMTADNLRINGADLRLDFSARSASDANGGFNGF